MSYQTTKLLSYLVQINWSWWWLLSPLLLGFVITILCGAAYLIWGTEIKPQP